MSSLGVGFSVERGETIAREDGLQLIEQGFVTFLPASPHPFRKLFRPGEFIEIYVRCPLAECEKRDGEGYYERARSGRIKGVTDVDSIYEKPENPELILETDKYDVETCLGKILTYLEEELII